MTSQITIPLIMALLAAFWFFIASKSRPTYPGTFKLALVGGVVAALLTLALALVSILEIPISAAIAIPMFVAAILEFGFLIALAARTLSGRLSQRTFLNGVLIIIAAILIGVALMFQPLTPRVFNLGFDFVLIALLVFNVWSHITPRPREQK